ncbi:hypothetical protein, partial [Glutamicibacter protophormiae]|uniref:hypothetical protein n=1 Tax=Glutamicibacter protophormiae TaxID=37930 RepID=UPI003BAEA24D
VKGLSGTSDVEAPCCAAVDRAPEAWPDEACCRAADELPSKHLPGRGENDHYSGLRGLGEYVGNSRKAVYHAVIKHLFSALGESLFGPGIMGQDRGLTWPADGGMGSRTAEFQGFHSKLAGYGF